MKTLIALIRRPFDDPPAEAPETPQEPSGSTETPEPTTETRSQNPDVSDRLEVLENELKRARDEAASRRVQNREQAAEFESFKKGLAAALGIETQEEQPDPEKMASTITELQAQNRALRLEKLWASAASKAGADADLTFALARSSDFVRDLDVDSAGIEESLVDYLEKAISENPKLRAGPGAPPRSGTEISGGTGTKTFTRAEIEGMTPDEIEKNWDAISEQMASGRIK
jgi:hypothetical protein